MRSDWIHELVGSTVRGPAIPDNDAIVVDGLAQRYRGVRPRAAGTVASHEGACRRGRPERVAPASLGRLRRRPCALKELTSWLS